MTDADRRFHEEWYGMVQPSEGLVVSIPVLVDAQCLERQPRDLHAKFRNLVLEDGPKLRLDNLGALLEQVLEFEVAHFDDEPALPKELSLYVPEGKQLLRPTRALKWAKLPEQALAADATPATLAARPYAMLVWEIPPAVDKLDKPETVTGDWDYPAQAKFERLLRECRVPIGLLSNGWEIRLVYVPHGESSGWLPFRIADMAGTDGRTIFDAFVMLLSRKRWFSVAPEHQLPAILAESRKRNADVTNDLSRQVFEALEVLLAGFAAADERDGKGLVREALERGDDHLFAGLLTVLLRLVFLLYCEDRALLPVESPLFESHYSLLGLFHQLQADQGRYPDTMHRRFGGYARLVSLFRTVYLGVKCGDYEIPARRGDLFDPNQYPFLEGWGPEGSAPITEPEDRASVQVPSVDDLTIFTVLHKLLYLDGQRLSYKALDVEQIGSVYEALMGFAVQRLTSGAVRIKLGSKKGAARVWVDAERLLSSPKAQRQSFLEDEFGFDKTVAAKIVSAVEKAKSSDDALTALEPLSGRRPERAVAGTLVIQPGPERRRTSSHYTPRALTEPIVQRTLEPLIKAIGESPASESLLNLVICDPAMGSGAFLVAACRYLADHVVAAWTREGRLEVIADAHDDVVNHARRLVAQRCLYGVDKNKYAVQLARLSLWLVTMAREEPFTFVDHALRHGDSLVGLNFDQIRAFHWKPGKQVETSASLLNEALKEAIGIRQQILELAAEGTWVAQREKERLLFDAEDALDRVRLIGDLVIGAFFSQAKDKDREKERNRRLDLVEQWLGLERRGDSAKADEMLAELRTLQAELKRTQVPFHWMVEFPEVFYAERPDPLDGGRRNGAAWIDGFVGNPPFMGGSAISGNCGEAYRDWLIRLHDQSHGNADLSAHFYVRAANLIGNHGAIGFIATNTIAQGDTRITGLARLSANGFRIFAATTGQSWPGDASVIVNVVCLAMGSAVTRKVELNGTSVAVINSRLRPNPERGDPIPLVSNARLSFGGAKVYGQGFLLSPEERELLVRRDQRNAERTYPYIGGEEVNTSPSHAFDRYVINFGSCTLSEAHAWPDLISIVEEKVKPERDRHAHNAIALRQKEKWWLFRSDVPELRSALAGLSRCLVTSAVTKHLVFSFQSVERVFSHKLYVFALDCHSSFAVLQSRVHVPWAWMLSSTMKTDLNYSASDCFEPFPFPHPNPRHDLPEVASVGRKLYEMRAQYMIDTNQGLTKTYNALKDSDINEPRIAELRQYHELMDRVVLDAYGWHDIQVPPYCPKTSIERSAIKSFEDEVVDRLFMLNAERAAQEQAAGGAKAKVETTGKPQDAAPPATNAGKRGAKKKSAKAEPEGQGSLF